MIKHFGKLQLEDDYSVGPLKELRVQCLSDIGKASSGYHYRALYHQIYVQTYGLSWK